MLKKDLIELCLLHLLAQEDQYGYELLRQLHDSFPDTQESAIYALLRGLCREGCSEQYLADSTDGPARKYYRLTPQGEARRTALMERWRTLTAALAALGIQ
ncbi:MAG: PadR family transcriptional regulator [Subdoligranulum sp.]|nr:PadR family transcriptional regulator [Subdoligranulum sp.]